MAEVEFHYNENKTIIKCREDQKISEIFNLFISKSNINENEINFYYHDKIVNLNDHQNVTFNNMANSFDKKTKNMKILVQNDLKYDDKIKFDKDKNNIFPGGEIKMKIKIEEYEIDDKIYFLDNTNSPVLVVKNINKDDKYEKIEEHHHDFLKDINESNVELYVNDKKYNFEKFFKFDKGGEYDILLKFKIPLNDCSFMFYDCSNLINIDLSLFNTKNITNMSQIFSGCSNLKNIDLSSFNTKSVINMFGMFSGCSNLKNINLSSFNIENVINMSKFFSQCSNLTNIDLSSFNTKNIIDMSEMFSGCSNLLNINLSSFNIENVTDMSEMFYNCSNLTNMDLSPFNTKNVHNMSAMFSGCSNLKNINLSSFNI